MPPQAIEKRVDTLEVRMTAVEQLPARIDKLTERVDGLTERVDGLKGEMKELGDRLDKKIEDSTIMVCNVLSKKIDDRFEEAKRHALALHEDLVERIERIGEGRGRLRRKQK